ncbi:MAG: hypothetical protein RLZZ558_1496 [Planctomycetota bacterium]|jgi:hypothetical protein
MLRGLRQSVEGRHHKAWWLPTLLAPFVAMGCQKVLFPKEEPRTQYQRTDQLRDRFTPLQEPDVFGNPRPALRARLTPPD